MSVIAYDPGDLFRVTIVKYLLANPERKWANNYELKAVIGGVTADLTAAALTLVDFEQPLHMTPVKFDRVRISTWEADSTPYDPTSFISLPLAPQGTGDVGASQLAALNVCWDVARIPQSGRFGHLFYRGGITETMIEAPAGKYIFTTPANPQSVIGAALTASGAGELLDGTDPNFQLVMVGKTEAAVRDVLLLQSRGVAVVPFNHGWFNRTPAGP